MDLSDAGQTHRTRGGEEFQPRPGEVPLSPEAARSLFSALLDDPEQRRAYTGHAAKGARAKGVALTEPEALSVVGLAVARIIRQCHRYEEEASQYKPVFASGAKRLLNREIDWAVLKELRTLFSAAEPVDPQVSHATGGGAGIDLERAVALGRLIAAADQPDGADVAEVEDRLDDAALVAAAPGIIARLRARLGGRLRLLEADELRSASSERPSPGARRSAVYRARVRQWALVAPELAAEVAGLGIELDPNGERAVRLLHLVEALKAWPAEDEAGDISPAAEQRAG